MKKMGKLTGKSPSGKYVGRRPQADYKHNVGQSPLSQGSVVDASNPMHLGFLPGTEGAGRVAATRKAGLQVSGSYYQNDNIADATIPTVSKICWVPTMGALYTQEQRTIVTTAMFRYYNYIRAKNASVSAFSPIDVMFALCGVSGVATLLSAIRVRLQVLCTTGSQINAAFPAGLMAAYSLTAADRTNLANYIVRFNELVKLAEGLIMPRSFKLFARQARLAGSVFLDDASLDKTQMIIMHPIKIWAWDLNPNSADVGKLYQETLGPNPNLTGLFSLAAQLIGIYTLDQDMNNIYAEIRKAFDPVDVYKLQTFPIDGEGITLEFDQLLLDEIHNATITGDLLNPLIVEEDTANNTIKYKHGNIECGVCCNFNEYPFKEDDMEDLDYHLYRDTIWVYSHENQPNEYAVADLTALKASFAYHEQFNTIASCGTELITRVYVYTLDSSNIMDYYHYRGINKWTYDPTSAGNALSAFAMFFNGLRAYQDIYYLPVIDIQIQTQDSLGNSSIGTFCVEGDVDNRFDITFDALDQIHSAAIAYLLAVE